MGIGWGHVMDARDTDIDDFAIDNRDLVQLRRVPFPCFSFFHTVVRLSFLPKWLHSRSHIRS